MKKIKKKNTALCISSRKMEALCLGFSEIFPVSSRWFQFQLMSLMLVMNIFYYI